ncbi:AMP-binding protein [Minwuia thermotolerans]|uniref:AMP-binding protein n=1 Tax=Minwuia thermotolerans TaxID=2056226 RepID=UPI000D6DC573|nr:AMP-binding protein [Minwuia thermotolerans]
MLVKGREIPWNTVPELLRDKAERFGDAFFCEIYGRRLSYAELDRLSQAVAYGLVAHDIKKGGCVASYMYNCAEQLFGWFAAGRVGAIWAPLNAALSGDDLAYAVRDAGATLLVVEDETWDRIAAIREKLPENLVLVGVGECGKVNGVVPFEELILEGGALPETDIGPGDPAMIIYTGGTTGLPKGVVLPHFAHVCAGLRYGEVLEARAGERHYSTLPLFHAGGVQLGIVGPLFNDMTVVMDRRFSGSGYWQRVIEVDADVIDPIGTMMTVLAQQEETPGERDHHVRITTGVSGQLPESVPARFAERFGIDIVDIYGLTEAGGGMLTSNRLGYQVPDSVGRPHGWCEVAVVDALDQSQPADVSGEIVMRPTVPFSFMLGYHNNAILTVEVMRNQWLHTGDIGRLDSAGNLFFEGRQVHWLRRRGENISAYEVENILSQHPAVEEVIVVGVPSELGEEEVKAYVMARAEAPDPVDLVEWCGTRMAAFKIPRFIEFVDDFPRSATKREVERGKVKDWGNANAWDRDRVMGRLSSQAQAKSGA